MAGGVIKIGEKRGIQGAGLPVSLTTLTQPENALADLPVDCFDMGSVALMVELADTLL